MKFLNFRTFQVFHDLYKPCLQRSASSLPYPAINPWFVQLPYNVNFPRDYEL